MTRPNASGIKGLHHNAYRCRDSEETRQFYEDFLGLPLAVAFELKETKTGAAVSALHTFYKLDDGSFLAFFEVPAMAFDFKEQHDYDLHIALEVSREHLHAMIDRAAQRGVHMRGISDHRFIDSIYFRDPNGYVIELTARRPNHDDATDSTKNSARANLDAWQRTK